jgi:3-hydroxyacyl-CoA dehydrogenase/enoyl-CoA hydratase/3-hydroxybutyryl-CoA epimerase
MTEPLLDLTQFRVEYHENGLVHLVFDCPGRSMNVFSNKAIHELGTFAEWLHGSGVYGVVVRSDKPSGFCAGADLTELGVAYDMIIAAPPKDRFDIAFDHFFPLSHAIRRLETAGVPVAAAIAGVALGGGCELALGCHYRVATDSSRSVLGLPECAVGLLPGAGGTQRMPRLVGLETGLEVLLLGHTLQGREALETGLVDEIVAEGDEVAAAERWLLSQAADAVQPWDRAENAALRRADLAAVIETHRTRELARMLGHEPAPLAILDCVELGMMQPIDGAIRAEMSIFAGLIQRLEPRNMIRTMFLGKQAFDRATREGSLASAVLEAEDTIAQTIARHVALHPELRHALFPGSGEALGPVRQRAVPGLWLSGQAELITAIRVLAADIAPAIAALDDAQLLQLDHLVTRSGSIPAYLGGATGLQSL